MTTETLAEYPASLADEAGVPYVARALGRRREDGLWEGWLEFERTGGGVRVRTERETTQPNHTDLVYWANGLTAVYLEGAFRRAMEAAPTGAPDAVASLEDGADANPILDPFEVYASGERALRARLGALAPRHLRDIARSYHLVADRARADAMSKAELVDVIVLAARAAAADEGLVGPASVP